MDNKINLFPFFNYDSPPKFITSLGVFIFLLGILLITFYSYNLNSDINSLIQCQKEGNSCEGYSNKIDILNKIIPNMINTSKILIYGGIIIIFLGLFLWIYYEKKKK